MIWHIRDAPFSPTTLCGRPNFWGRWANPRTPKDRICKTCQKANRARQRKKVHR
jgi:hypothetical protein